MCYCITQTEKIQKKMKIDISCCTRPIRANKTKLIQIQP